MYVIVVVTIVDDWSVLGPAVWTLVCFIAGPSAAGRPVIKTETHRVVQYIYLRLFSRLKLAGLHFYIYRDSWLLACIDYPYSSSQPDAAVPSDAHGGIDCGKTILGGIAPIGTL